MKYYTETIPVTLAEKLKEKGMPMKMTIHTLDSFTVLEDSAYAWLDEELGQKPQKVDKYYVKPKYSEVFDWLMSERNLAVIIYRMTQNFRIAIRSACSGILRADVWGVAANGKDADWHEAANAAIEKALTLI